MKTKLKTLFAATIIATPMMFGAVQADDHAEQSLFNRLGGEDKVRKIVNDTYHNHVTNPIIQGRFVDRTPIMRLSNKKFMKSLLQPPERMTSRPNYSILVWA